MGRARKDNELSPRAAKELRFIINLKGEKLKPAEILHFNAEADPAEYGCGWV